MPSSTRQRIIDASTTAFMRRGLAGAGLKQIAEESEATIGSLDHFFPGGTDELAAEVLRSSGAAYQAIVEAVFGAAPDVVAGVRDCFAAAAVTLAAADYADACPVATVALEVASSDDGLRQVTADVFEGWLQAATRRFVAAGVSRRRARDLATTLVAALEGGFLLSRAAKDTAPLHAIGRSMVSLVEAAVAGVSTVP